MDGDESEPTSLTYYYVGQHESSRKFPVTDRVLQQAKDCGYDMLTTSISTPQLHASVWKLISTYTEELESGASPFEIPIPVLPPFSPSETYLTPGESVGQLLAFTSSWIDLASPDPVVANISRQILNQEIAYATFCGVGNIVVQGPQLYRGKARDDGIAQYARAVLEALGLGCYVQVHILMPMAAAHEDVATPEVAHLASLARPEYRDAAADYRNAINDSTLDERLLEAWDAWNLVRSICKYSPRLSVCLDIPAQLPPTWLQSRWFSEPVRMLLLSSQIFVPNAAGYLVLSRPHQALIYHFMRLKTAPWMLLGEVGPIPGLTDPATITPMASGFLSPDHTDDAQPGVYPTLAEAAHMASGARKLSEDPLSYLNYIRHLQRHQPPKPIIERFGAGYQDYLQAPLQPLTDNLESITYEVFEKDPIKYEWYERAITRALQDWVREGKSTSSTNGAVVVAVVGAGRGPLVTRALNASANSRVPIEMYAVEKNPNAYVLLQRHNEEDWSRRVTIVKSDMRSWRGPMLHDGSFGHVDIIVSELLGSFGDNELSPECLDGVQHVLNPTAGISIPTSYTAHLTPIAAPRLHADILNRTQTDSTAPETPHVVMLHAIDYLSTRHFESIELQADSEEHTSHKHKGRSKRRKNVSLEKYNPNPCVETCWSFVHPLPPRVLAQAQLRKGGGLGGGAGGSTGGDGANEHNTRFWRGSFPVRHRGVCHGLAGYFETVLYESTASWSTVGGGTSIDGVSDRDGADLESSKAVSHDTDGHKVELSTNPETMDAKSKDMISWFPIFFPLQIPLYIPDDAELQVSIWRQTDDRKVWYEWLVESFAIIGEKRIALGASELHSSKKSGCLM